MRRSRPLHAVTDICRWTARWPPFFFFFRRVWHATINVRFCGHWPVSLSILVCLVAKTLRGKNTRPEICARNNSESASCEGSSADCTSNLKLVEKLLFAIQPTHISNNTHSLVPHASTPGVLFMEASLCLKATIFLQQLEYANGSKQRLQLSSPMHKGLHRVKGAPVVQHPLSLFAACFTLSPRGLIGWTACSLLEPCIPGAFL